MRDVIALALTYVLRLVLPSRGRHAAAPALALEPARVSPWDLPWPTPTPAHVTARYISLRGEDMALIRLYYRAETTMQLGVIKAERRRAAELASMGVDHPYTYPGAPFPRSAFAAAGVSA